MRIDKALAYIKSESEAGSIKLKLQFSSSNLSRIKSVNKDAEDSAEEQSQNKFEIPDKVDGYKQFQDNIPLACVKLSQFQEAVNSIKSTKADQSEIVLKSLRKKFPKIIAWQKDQD